MGRECSHPLSKFPNPPLGRSIPQTLSIDATVQSRIPFKDEKKLQVHGALQPSEQVGPVNEVESQSQTTPFS